MKKLLLFACLLALLAGCSKKEEPIPANEKCKASDYPQVTIGTQTWMAENYRCSQYDTESEAYKDGRKTISTSNDGTYGSYYTNSTDKSKWKSMEYSGNLSNTQIDKIGYGYSWAAAVGLSDGKSQIAAFSGNRQGICPNGWHVPTNAEWQSLYDFIKSEQIFIYFDMVAKHLKSTSGWYSGDSDYKPGLDTYGFSALPAGYAYGSSVYHVGFSTDFWTATPSEYVSSLVYNRYLIYYEDGLNDTHFDKGYGQSVRCLKD